MQYFHWSGRGDTLLSNIANLYKCGLCVDCILCAEGQYLRAHKVILCASSPYLQSLLLKETEDETINYINFKDIKFVDLKNLVSFIYNGEIEIAEGQVSSFISSARKLQIVALPIDTCEETIEPKNSKEDGENCPVSVNETSIPVISESSIKSELDVGEDENFPTQFERVFVKEEVHSSEDESEESKIDGATDAEFISKPRKIYEDINEGQNNHFLLGHCYTSQTEVKEEIHSDPTVEESDNSRILPEVKEDESFVLQKDSFVTAVPRDSPHAEPFACTLCPLTFSRQWSLCQHQRAHTADKSFACQYCGATFAVRANYKRHVRLHTGDRPYRCHVCPSAFVARGHLVSHLRIHTGEKPHRCDICPAAFAERGALNRHARAHHGGQRPFACAVCSATFAGRADLKRHLRQHTGEKPFACTLCPATFARSDALKKHARAHLGERPFACAVCSTTFAGKEHLKRHARLHTGEKPFACALCPATFARRDALKKHAHTHAWDGKADADANTTGGS